VPVRLATGFSNLGKEAHGLQSRFSLPLRGGTGGQGKINVAEPAHPRLPTPLRAVLKLSLPPAAPKARPWMLL